MTYTILASACFLFGFFFSWLAFILAFIQRPLEKGMTQPTKKDYTVGLCWQTRLWRFFFRRIGEGEDYPWYLGFVTTRFADDAKIVTFLGFNWVCQIALRIWLRVRQGVPLWDRRILRQWEQCSNEGQRFTASS